MTDQTDDVVHTTQQADPGSDPGRFEQQNAGQRGVDHEAPTETLLTVSHWATDDAPVSAPSAGGYPGNPALQQLDPRKLREIHHGRTGAMWTAVVIMTIAFVAGGVAMLLGPNWAGVIISGGLLVAGAITGMVLRALGYGLHERT